MSQSNTKNNVEKLTHLIETVHRLRAPGGCPWDREQTHQSLRKYIVEEAYEVIDVIDRIASTDDLKKPDIKAAFREELGDLLMQVVLHSEMTTEAGAFDFYDVAQGLDEKLIRRHPHVFGDVKADSADGAVASWEKQKLKEKTGKAASALDGVPKSLPALQKTERVIEKVTKVGFQWSDMQGPLAKLEEELGEFKAEVEKLEGADKTTSRAKLQGELGDLLFSLCNVAYLMKLSPEDALRGTLSRFESRFRHVESRLRENGKTPEQSNLDEMDLYWNEAKKLENKT